jgi:hypothetical protein
MYEITAKLNPPPLSRLQIDAMHFRSELFTLFIPCIVTKLETHVTPAKAVFN